MKELTEHNRKPVIMSGGVAADDRGHVRFVNDFNFDQVQRFYQISNHKKGFIRAWHGHLGEGKYVYVAKGSALIGAVQMIPYDEAKPEEVGLQAAHDPLRIVLSDTKPTVLWIPPGYANGAMTLEDDTIIMYFSTASMEETKGDDMRFDWSWCDIWDIEER